MSIFVDCAAKKDCYAFLWSYGEICVGCGCCSKDPLKRAKARLEYHKECLKEWQAFNCWEDDPEISAIQQKNISENIRYDKRKIRQYTALVEKLEARAAGGDKED